MKLASKIATLAFGLTAFSAAQAAAISTEGLNADDMIASAKENIYVGATGSLVTGAFGPVPGLLLLPYLPDTLGVAA